MQFKRKFWNDAFCPIEFHENCCRAKRISSHFMSCQIFSFLFENKYENDMKTSACMEHKSEVCYMLIFSCHFQHCFDMKLQKNVARREMTGDTSGSTWIY